MSATYTLFTKWQKAKGYVSAMAACDALGITRASATNWKNGRNAEAPIIERMAKDLGEQPAAWVLAAASEKTIKADEQRTLLRLAKSLGYAAAIVLFIGSGHVSIMSNTGSRIAAFWQRLIRSRKPARNVMTGHLRTFEISMT